MKKKKKKKKKQKKNGMAPEEGLELINTRSYILVEQMFIIVII